MNTTQIAELAAASANDRRRALTSLDPEQARELLVARAVHRASVRSVRRTQWLSWLGIPQHPQRWLGPVAASAMLAMALLIGVQQPANVPSAAPTVASTDALFSADFAQDALFDETFEPEDGLFTAAFDAEDNA